MTIPTDSASKLRKLEVDTWEMLREGRTGLEKLSFSESDNLIYRRTATIASLVGRSMDSVLSSQIKQQEVVECSAKPMDPTLLADIAELMDRENRYRVHVSDIAWNFVRLEVSLSRSCLDILMNERREG